MDKFCAAPQTVCDGAAIDVEIAWMRVKYEAANSRELRTELADLIFWLESRRDCLPQSSTHMNPECDRSTEK